MSAWLGGRRGLATGNGRCQFLASSLTSYAWGSLERVEDAGELKARLGTIFVIVDARMLLVVATAGHPFVGTVKADVQQFSTAECIALGQTDNQLRSVLATRLATAVCFDIEIIGLVEQTVDIEVENAARVAVVVGCKVEIG